MNWHFHFFYVLFNRCLICLHHVMHALNWPFIITWVIHLQQIDLRLLARMAWAPLVIIVVAKAYFLFSIHLGRWNLLDIGKFFCYFVATFSWKPISLPLNYATIRSQCFPRDSVYSWILANPKAAPKLIGLSILTISQISSFNPLKEQLNLCLSPGNPSVFLSIMLPWDLHVFLEDSVYSWILANPKAAPKLIGLCILIGS